MSYIDEKQRSYSTANPVYKRVMLYGISLVATFMLAHSIVSDRLPTTLAATKNWRPFKRPSATPYLCPFPTSAPLNSSVTFQDLTAPASVHSSDPAFKIRISHAKSACNAFRLDIARTDGEYCADAGKRVQPLSEDMDTEVFIKNRLGPDSFQIKIDGAERRVLYAPTTYNETECRYRFDVQLNAAGPVWLDVQQIYTDFDAMHEEKAHEPAAIYSELFSTPLQLNICSSACATYIPPQVGQSVFEYPNIPSVEEDQELPPCTGPEPIKGTYVPSNPMSRLNPPFELPMAANRPIAGQYEFVPSGCAYDHAGLRFRDHTQCLQKPHSALFLGDSHTANLCHSVTHRLVGGPEIAKAFVKDVPLLQHFKNSNGQTNSSVDFVWDAILAGGYTCDYLSSFDSITVSTGAHHLAFLQPTAREAVAQVQTRLEYIADTLEECAAGNLPKLIFMGTSAHQSEHIATHLLDSRSGQRIDYLNNLVAPIARENGFQVLDSFALTAPMAPDTAYIDGIHFLKTDAMDPLVDEWYQKSGFCD